MTIAAIANGESGLSVRGKLNAAIAEVNTLGSELSAVIFVRSGGDDANPGTQLHKPKQTLGSAVTAASALLAAGAAAIRIDVVDGGTYTEAAQLEIPSDVHVTAPASIFIGTVAVSGNSSFTVNKHFAPSNDAVMVEHAGGGAGAGLYVANICDGRGVGGSLTGVNNFRSSGGGGRNLFVRPGIVYVGAGGIGLGEVSVGDAGHSHLLIADLYLAGNNAVGILGASQGAGASNVIGFIDHILEIGSPTGTVGIRVNAAAAIVKLVCGEVVADTAYDVSNGTLHLNCLKVTGTITKTGGVVVRPTLTTT